MSRVYFSNYVPAELFLILSSFGEPCRLPIYKRLPVQIGSHADILLFNNDGSLYLPWEYYLENRDIFDGVDVYPIDEEFGLEYKSHVWLDCLLMGKDLLCLEKFTAKVIAEKYNVVNVRQGYARCSTLKLNDNAIITADAGICKRAIERGIDVLHISSEGVRLTGYSCGFIGGASAVLGDTIVFFGDITRHPDWNEIGEFINKYEMKIKYTTAFPLTDYGSAVMV